MDHVVDDINDTFGEHSPPSVLFRAGRSLPVVYHIQI